MPAENIKERLVFHGVSEIDFDLAEQAWPIMEKALPALLAEFYNKVREVPHLAEMLGNQEARLVAAQTKHWKNLFHLRCDDTYYESARRIGLAHVKIGLHPTWYVGGYSFVQSRLTPLFIRNFRLRPSRAAELLQAAGKLIFLDMDLAISIYHDEMVAQANGREMNIRAAVSQYDSMIQEQMTTLSQASLELEGTSGTLSGITADLNTRIGSMSQQSNETTSNVTSSAAATEEMTSAIDEIGRQATLSSQIAREAVDGASKTNTSMSRLSEAANTVGSVIGLISDIAEQTNLLALNATIEAARAGEAGKGFAVVAAEVKELATQTTKATEDITGQIASIQEATEQSVLDIEQITQTINRVSEIATNIASAVEQQTAATNEISSNVQAAARSSETFTSEIGSVRVAIGEAEQSASQVSLMSQDLKEQADRLGTETAQFLKRVLEN